MPAGQTSITGADANANALQILAASDGTHVAPGHSLFDITGVPTGTNANPLYVSDGTVSSATGTISDTAYTGTGSGTVIAVLKSLYSKLAATLTVTGTVTVNPLPAGANNVGSVNVAALPPLAIGTNSIGTVGVTALPSIPTGGNAIGTVGVTTLPSLPTGGNAIGTVGVTSLPSLPAGSSTIGNVNLYAGGVAAGISTVPLYTRPSTITLVSRSVSSTVASTSTALVAANTSRRVLRVTAPQTASIWLNLLGGTCAPNAIDCIMLPAGSMYESVDGNAVSYYCATAGLVIAAFEG